VSAAQARWITIYAREGHTFAVIAGCDSIQRRTTVTPANGRRAGKRFIVRREALTPGIRWVVYEAGNFKIPRSRLAAK
jgi:hypothetical protein